MQKQVSKQSLAVLALSILLAISMALTATFASFTASKDAKGIITFNAGSIAVTLEGGAWTAGQGDDAGKMVLTLNNTHFDISGENVVLNTQGVAAIQALQMAVTGVPTGFKVNINVAVGFDAVSDIVTLEGNSLTQQTATEGNIAATNVFKTVTAVPQGVAPSEITAASIFTVTVTATAVTAA